MNCNKCSRGRRLFAIDWGEELEVKLKAEISNGTSLKLFFGQMTISGLGDRDERSATRTVVTLGIVVGLYKKWVCIRHYVYSSAQK